MRYALFSAAFMLLCTLPVHAQMSDEDYGFDYSYYEWTQDIQDESEPPYYALEEDEPGPWERNRAKYQAKREAYIEKRMEHRQEYKDRIDNNLYRQKAREFYGRQPNIYDR